MDGEQRLVVEPADAPVGLSVDADDATKPLFDGWKVVHA
jgi:hypothetical protein